jgi:hypothetical protein
MLSAVEYYKGQILEVSMFYKFFTNEYGEGQEILGYFLVIRAQIEKEIGV